MIESNNNNGIGNDKRKRNTPPKSESKNSTVDNGNDLKKIKSE